ncbi:MAG: neutral zinc metallopeptidase, partial [Gemmatimonadaceae bacterium]|nr:neutral zinc metallopeptidase [Chitinophagaceae bacterium]
MKWLGGRESTNVDDRRGISGGGLAVGGGVIGVIIYLINMFLGGDTSQLPQQLPQLTEQQSQMSPQEKAADDERAKFVKVVLGLTEDVWDSVFAGSGQQYSKPVLVLFRDRVESACGMASAASGPFYCPPDQQLYIDLAFYQELQDRFQAPGDFAMAYVIAHEVGHHIQ